MNKHWRSYEQMCPCEVDYNFIGHSHSTLLGQKHLTS